MPKGNAPGLLDVLEKLNKAHQQFFSPTVPERIAALSGYERILQSQGLDPKDMEVYPKDMALTQDQRLTLSQIAAHWRGEVLRYQDENTSLRRRVAELENRKPSRRDRKPQAAPTPSQRKHKVLRTKAPVETGNDLAPDYSDDPVYREVVQIIQSIVGSGKGWPNRFAKLFGTTHQKVMGFRRRLPDSELLQRLRSWRSRPNPQDEAWIRDKLQETHEGRNRRTKTRSSLPKQEHDRVLAGT